MLITWGPEGEPPVCPDCGAYMMAKGRTECVNCGTRAEAPQGDGFCKRAGCGRLSYDIIHAETGHAGHHRFAPTEDSPKNHLSSCREIHGGECPTAKAAQPETGDEGRVREIVDRHGFAGIVEAVREALRAGRAAENEACEGIARMLPQTPRVNVARAIAEKIAARRGSGR